MGSVSASISIDAPREEVFAILLDVSARPAFMDHFVSDFRLLREEPVGVGAGSRFRIDAANASFDLTIEEADPPVRIVERGQGGYLNRVPNALEWALQDLPAGGGCELTVTFVTAPERAYDKLRDARVSGRRLRCGFERALERLRDRIEAGEPFERVVIGGGDRVGV